MRARRLRPFDQEGGDSAVASDHSNSSSSAFASLRSAREDIRVREAPIRRPLGGSSYPKATFGFAQTATIGWTADPRQFPSGRLDRAEIGHPRARDRTMIQYPCYETRPLTMGRL